MPICRTCKIVFDGVYRKKYCSTKCQFLSKVPSGLSDSECWNWGGGKSTAGYGAFNTGEKIELTHRFSYQLFKGLSLMECLSVTHATTHPALTLLTYLSGRTMITRLIWRKKGALHGRIGQYRVR